MDDLYVLKMTAHLAPKCHSIKESDLPIGSEDIYGNDAIELREPDDDAIDNLEEMLLDAGDPSPTYKEFRFELCDGCHRKFLADPLNREAFKFAFSKN